MFDGLNFILTAGMRVGLVGPNGSGKTTLLRLLQGDLAPTGGEIRRADWLRIVYFDQTRTLDPDVTLRRALAPDGDSVVYRDRVIHVAGWAARFLFTGEQLSQPVGRLSGGERARVLIAQLMLQPADILLLDEPTNDLDIPTLEILEESLIDFPGSLVLVTHDRYMLDRVSSIVLGLNGKGEPIPSPTTRNGSNGSRSAQSQTQRRGAPLIRVLCEWWAGSRSIEKETLLPRSAGIRHHRAASRRSRTASESETRRTGRSSERDGCSASSGGASRAGCGSTSARCPLRALG